MTRFWRQIVHEDILIEHMEGSQRNSLGLWVQALSVLIGFLSWLLIGILYLTNQKVEYLEFSGDLDFPP